MKHTHFIYITFAISFIACNSSGEKHHKIQNADTVATANVPDTNSLNKDSVIISSNHVKSPLYVVGEFLENNKSTELLEFDSVWKKQGYTSNFPYLNTMRGIFVTEEELNTFHSWSNLSMYVFQDSISEKPFAMFIFIRFEKRKSMENWFAIYNKHESHKGIESKPKTSVYLFPDYILYMQTYYDPSGKKHKSVSKLIESVLANVN